MRNLIKKMAKPENFATLGVFAIAAIAMFAPELALAATGGNEGNIKLIVGEGVFKDVITLAFGIFAFIKWIDYIAEFSAGGGALKGLIVPGVATFLAFKWAMVLSWFKLV